MSDRTAFVVLNLAWFGFWFVIVFFGNESPWWFLFPVIIHWTMKDVSSRNKPLK